MIESVIAWVLNGQLQTVLYCVYDYVSSFCDQLRYCSDLASCQKCSLVSHYRLSEVLQWIFWVDLEASLWAAFLLLAFFVLFSLLDFLQKLI